MADVHKPRATGTPDRAVSTETSARMSRVRSKDTKPELIVRQFLHAHGQNASPIRYRSHDKKLPGTPDVVLPKYKTVIFVHVKTLQLDA